MKRPPPDFLTIAEIADCLGTSDSYVYQIVATIPGAWKLGRLWRLTRNDLDAFIAIKKDAHAAKLAEGAARRERWIRGEDARKKKKAETTGKPPSVEPVVPLPRPRHPSPSMADLRASLANKAR